MFTAAEFSSVRRPRTVNVPRRCLGSGRATAVKGGGQRVLNCCICRATTEDVCALSDRNTGGGSCSDLSERDRSMRRECEAPAGSGQRGLSDVALVRAGWRWRPPVLLCVVQATG